MGNKESKLTVRFCNKKPVELIDFTESLLGVGQQYIRYIERHPEDAEAKDVKLYIKEVRPGSIVADLIALAPLAIPFAEQANSIIGFASHAKSVVDYLLGRGEKPADIEKKDYDNYSKIVNPVAKDESAQLNLSVVINGDVTQTFNINYVEANAVQNKINRDLLDMKEPVERLQRKVVLYWYQARNDPKSKAGDKAIIESVSQLPIKTVFGVESLKHEMLFDSDINPFKFAYVVDVYVETIQNRPAVYKLIEFHEKFLKPVDDENDQQQKMFNT